MGKPSINTVQSCLIPIMKFVCFAIAFAAVAAAQLSPHPNGLESPETEYCSNHEDPLGHKCYQGCATKPFKNKDLEHPGVCNPHLFNKVTSTKKVLQCSDGVTNTKYCAAPLYTVTVTMEVLGEGAVAVAEASVASMFVHQIVTSPGDHCLEITIPGGDVSPFWKANAWKYSAPDRPEWKTGACDHTKWDEVDSTTENYDGYTAAKNTPYAAVSLNKCGIKTATPAPTPIPDPIEQYSLISGSAMKCETTSGTHSVTVVNPLKIDLVVRTCDKYDPVSGAPCTGNMLKTNHYIDCPQNIAAGASTTFSFNGDTQYIAFTDAAAHTEVNEMWPSPVGEWPKSYTVKPAAVSVAFDICDPAGTVHAFGTDGNDKGKCLEIAFGGGKGQSHFWQKDGWKYSTNKVWSDGKCDRTAFPTVSSFTKDFGGWTAATNSDQVPSCGNVNFTKFNPTAVTVELEATAVTTSCTKDSDCPGNYCMDGPDKTPPYSCHDDPTPTPPTPPPPAPTWAPNCTQAGQDDLCKITCESTCRGFQPGFKAAGCADQEYCTNPPAWAKGSVCKCSSTPPAPPTPPPAPPTPPPPTPPAPAGVPTCAQAGKTVLCQVACESTCRSFQPGFKAAGCADEKYCTNPPAWAKGSVCNCPAAIPVAFDICDPTGFVHA